MPQWAALAVLSLALTGVFVLLGLPGALLIGPMLTGIGLGCLGATIRVPRPGFVAAQGVVGCVVAHAVTAQILTDIVRDWPVMLVAVAITVGASGLVGWLAARLGTLPGPTAVLGMTPGAASAVVAMAEDFGADIRLVALMQYLRLVCVVAAASVVARFLAGPAGAGGLAGPAAAASSGFGSALDILLTLAVAVGGSWLGARLRLPAGGLLLPLVLGATLHATGLLDMALPDLLLGAAYAALGWYIGLQFDRPTVIRSLRVLPEVLLATLALILLCAGSAWLLTRMRGFDPLTAFLATTPGGIDAVAIIASGANADAGFVLALQTLRLLAVIAIGPALSGAIARRVARRS